jgi:tetratricopeptide (TPR) repeat protein
LFLERRRERFDEAEELYRRAVDAAPSNYQALLSLAIFLQIRGELEEAEELYRRAMAVSGDNPETLRQYAFFQQLYRRDTDRAKELFEDVIRLYKDALTQKPHNVNVISSLAGVEIECGQFSDAEELLASQPNLMTNPQLLVKYAKSLSHDENKRPLASALATRAAELVPNDHIILREVGWVFRDKAYDLRLAEHYWRRAQKSRSGDINLQANIAQLLLVSEGRADEGRAIVQRVLNLASIPIPLRLELLLYTIAHDLGNTSTYEHELEALLSQGYRSIGWDFGPTLGWVQKNRAEKFEHIRELTVRIIS